MDDVLERRTKILVVGAFPPPLHGMSHATLSMAKFFADSGLSTVLLDTAHAFGRSDRTSKFLRAIARVNVLLRLLFLCAAGRGNAVLYMAASAGMGQLGEMGYPIVARVFGVPVIVHHHSFAYLDRPSRSVRAFFRMCGDTATHVVLCSRMATLMHEIYGTPRTVVLSNAAVMDISLQEIPKAGVPRTIGFLGNITRDKGIDTYIDLLRLLRARNVEVSGLVAGPVVDADCQNLVTVAADEGLISHAGAVYGDSKLEFLRSVDVLFFPSRYRNEAEPFVILESQAFGIPVIATPRGCTDAIVDDENGLLIDSTESALEQAADRIEFWINHPEEFASVRSRVLTKLRSLIETAREEKLSLVSKALARNAA